MDFEEFEQLVLKVLFETDVPVTAAHIAYLGRISVRTAEKHLARMVEQGTLLVRAAENDNEGVVEYIYPGRRPLTTTAPVAMTTMATTPPSPIMGGVGGMGGVPGGAAAGSGPPAITIGDPFFLAVRPKHSPVTAVLLSMLIPGAGHIYAGRAGAGVAWMATTLMGYACCFLPGLFLHGLCLVSAAQTRQA